MNDCFKLAVMTAVLVYAFPAYGTTLHDNRVFFINGGANFFTLRGYKITDGQPWDGIEVSYGGGQAEIDVRAGRQGSEDVADWFINGRPWATGTRHPGNIGVPDKLNFAIWGTITLVDGRGRTMVCDDVVIGQGYNGYNNWWVTSLNMNAYGTEAWLQCPSKAGEGGGILRVAPKSGTSNYFTLTFFGCPQEKSSLDQLPEVTPIIMANGVPDEYRVLPEGDALSISVDLDVQPPLLGESGEWWVILETEGGWYSYLVGRGFWVYVGDSIDNVLPSYEGPLVDVSALPILPETNLWPGLYHFYFGIDDVPNGRLDFDRVDYDEAIIRIE